MAPTFHKKCDFCGIHFDTEKDYLKLCSDCFFNRKEEYALLIAKETRSTAKMLGLKALTGSPKQKKWAEKLRLNFLEKITTDKLSGNMSEYELLLSSKFWIDARLNENFEKDLIRLLELTTNADSSEREALIKKLNIR